MTYISLIQKGILFLHKCIGEASQN
jgi:hypothetical protein